MFGDHISVQWALDEIEEVGWYSFAPVPWAKTGAAPRIAADGPSPHAEFIAVGRPVRKMVKPELRYRPGWYHGSCRGGTRGFVGSKPLWIMERLLGDYSEPGDVVCDPFAGTGTTLLAARRMGRHAIGAERDESAFALARARLAEPEGARDVERGRDRDTEASVSVVSE
jgi:site-specific DNA-methyltransferase (adenine-specific)